MEKKGLKKLVLKKEVLAQLNESSMKEIKGGYGVNEACNTHFACMTIRAACKSQNSCTVVACW